MVGHKQISIPLSSAICATLTQDLFPNAPFFLGLTLIPVLIWLWLASVITCSGEDQTSTQPTGRVELQVRFHILSVAKPVHRLRSRTLSALYPKTNLVWCDLPGKTLLCPPRGGGSPKIWVVVYDPLLETLTLFWTKICDFPYPISDLTQNSIPYFRPSHKLLGFAQTSNLRY